MKGFRAELLRVKFSWCVPVPTPGLELMYAGAAKAEACGFWSIWYADHLTMIPPGGGQVFEAWSFLTALACKTKRVKLCTGVSDVHRIHPAVMAQKVATLDQISGGRAMIGVGLGEAMNLDAYGLPRSASLGKLREFVEVMRLLWGKRRKATFEGSHFNLKRAYLQVHPVGHVPVYVAANGPKSRRLAGEVGDGWYPFFESPETFAKHKRDVDAGISASKDPEEKAGRYDYAYNCFVAVADDHDAAVERLRFFKSMCVSMPQKFNEAYGLDLPTNLHLHDVTMESEGADALLSCADQVPDRALEDFNVAGTVDEVIAQVERFQKAGCTHLVLMNRGPDVNRVYEVFRDEVIPAFQDPEDQG
ncbi:MAG: 5,10-methylenetetrahydromethanopterin reductase [Promethearchaeota archaeon]